MHRQFSLQPFSRHYSHSTNPFLDFLDVSSDGSITTKPSEHDKLLRVVKAYKKVHEQGLLHSLTFVTVNDYLWLLRAVSQVINTPLSQCQNHSSRLQGIESATEAITVLPCSSRFRLFLT